MRAHLQFLGFRMRERRQCAARAGAGHARDTFASRGHGPLLQIQQAARCLVASILVVFGALVHAQSDAAVKIEVDAARTSAMPDLLRAGIFAFSHDPNTPLPPDYALQQWLTEMRPGVVEIDIGGSVFQLAEDADDAVARAKKLVPVLKRIRAAGGEPVLAITRIPVWLSSRPRDLDAVKGDVVPKAAIVAPRDGKEWSALVARVVSMFKQELGRTPDIKVGWEPDQSAWQGSEDEFFAFYRDTAAGVKRADAEARVGGPSVSALFNGKGGEGSAPMIPRFLRYCASTAVPEQGLKRLPVDFLIWHQFGSDAVLAWDLAAAQARSWLKDAGYPESTPLMIGEWSSWLAWPNPQSEEQDKPALAAYIVASLAAMDKAGIQRAAFTSLLEQREVEGQPFIGSFGVFTNQFVKKPSYWAFSAISKLGNTRVQARSSDALVSAIAGKPSAREVAVVIASSTPGDKALLRTLIAKLFAAGVSFDQIRGELDERKISRLLSGESKPADLRLSDKLKSALEAALPSVLPLVQSSRAARGKTRSISVDLNGFDLASGNVEIWRIDSRHANALNSRDRITSYVQQRLNQEKQTLPQGVMQRFNERGYRQDQIGVFSQIRGARNPERELGNRSVEERRAVRGMAADFQYFVYERLAGIGAEINAWPELAFKADDQSPRINIRPGGKSVEFEMEDDSVVLLRFIKR